MRRGRRPSFLRRRASFPDVVVLPAPFRPQSKMCPGALRFSGAASPPKSSVSASLKTLTICSPGLTDLMTSSPMAFSFTVAMKSLATENSTSASRRDMRISRRASLIFFSEILPTPRKLRNVLSRLSDREENMMFKRANG